MESRFIGICYSLNALKCLVKAKRTKLYDS